MKMLVNLNRPSIFLANILFQNYLKSEEKAKNACLLMYFLNGCFGKTDKFGGLSIKNIAL